MGQIRRFTAAYDRACEAARLYKFGRDWQQFLTDKVAMRALLAGPDGPSSAHSAGLDALRNELSEIARKVGGGTNEGDVLLEMAGIKGKQALTDEQADALATLKMLRHLYYQQDRLNQAVWIYAQPFSFHRWVFDEIRGCTPEQARCRLNQADEVYPTAIRGHMVSGLVQALRWSQLCVSKLGAPDVAMRSLIGRWFMPGTPLDDDLRRVAAALLAGFKKIATLCNSTAVVFSDEPIDRMTGAPVAGQHHYRSNWEDYGFVDAAKPRERLNVIYIQGATLEKWSSANQGWMATLVIIHELSHSVVNTKDAAYDFSGIKPGRVLTQQHALVNADSWAYFAADVSGQLPGSQFAKVMREPPALRAAYLASLQNP